MYGNAGLPGVGVTGTSSGNGMGSSEVSTQTTLLDNWIISVPAGTAAGTVFTLPVTFTVDGTISAGAVYSPYTLGFLRYQFLLNDIYGPLGNGSSVDIDSFVTTTGTVALSFTQDVSFEYYGAAVPSGLQASFDLSIPGLYEGTVDFYDTASAFVDLPPGFTATTSSGLPLFVQAVTPPAAGTVPEPPMLLLMSIGLIGVAWHRRRRAPMAMRRALG